MSCLPDGVQAPSWYEPNERGLEIKLREKLEFLRALDREASSGL
jgi:putative ATPase